MDIRRRMLFRKKDISGGDGDIEVDTTYTIYYTSSDGKVVQPYRTNVFGANIVSNNYIDGHGIISFDGSVTTIGNYAFYNCKSLTSVNIPDSVTTIEEYAFRNCSAMTDIHIGNNVATIGSSAFYGCNSLISVNIGDSVTTIGESAFSYCSAMTDIHIGNNVATIGSSAFYKITNTISEFRIPNSYVEYKSLPQKIGTLIVEKAALVETNYESSSGSPFGSYILGSSVSTNIIRLSPSIKRIGTYAFAKCNLEKIEFPSSLTYISTNAFFSANISEITIPESVTTIENYAFQYTKGHLIINSKSLIEKNYSKPGAVWSDANYFSQITIGNGISRIGSYACRYFRKATVINIPDSVTKIGDYGFYDCESLTSVNIPDSVTSIGEWAFRSCSSLTSVNIPDSVTTIGRLAFADCTSLTSVTIGDSVTTIGEYTFRDCDSLTSVYCKATTPPALGNSSVFDTNGSGRKIYVPSGSVDAYKSATRWNEYASDIVGYDF